MKTHALKTSVLLAVTAVMAASCSTTPSLNPSIETARAHYRTAAADPQAVEAAPAVLRQAEENLRRADEAWKRGANPAEVEHLAYLADRQAMIVMESGRLAGAQQIVETADASRNRVLLESRNQALTREREAYNRRLATQQQALALANETAERQARQAAQLRQDLAAMQAKETPLGMVMTMDDVLFDTAEADIKPGAERSLDRLAEFMNKYPERTISIEGFTDSTGSTELNQQLSRQRARAVREELIQRGVSPERLQAVGYGPAFPVASNATAAGRQENRRVEILFSDESGKVKRRSSERLSSRR